MVYRESLTTGRFAVVASEKRSNANSGEVFVTGQLRNRDGMIRFIAGKGIQGADGRPMAPADLVLTFEEGRVVDVAGKLGEFRGDLQLEIRTASPVSLGTIDPEDFMPRSRFSSAELRAAYDALIGSVQAPWTDLVSLIVESNYKTFATWPAAKSFHHAWIGGLLEHTVEVARIALDIAAPVWDGVSAYESDAVFGNRIRRWPSVDLDLLVAAALLHDIGKLEELDVRVSTSYNDAGQALGHIHLGLFTIRDACTTLGLDPFDIRRILHCIASHHGVPEYGSSIRPATAEALILSQADELSARLAVVSEALAADPRGSRGWTERLPAFDRRIWLQAARVARDRAPAAADELTEQVLELTEQLRF